MFPRNSKHKGNHRIEPTKNTDGTNLTKYQILEKFDVLLAQQKAVKGEELASNVLRLRYTMQVLHFYPVVYEALEKDIYFSNNFDRDTLMAKLCSSSKAPRSTYLDDYLHVGHIMKRYNLDLNKAFDFWVLNNLLREEFKFNSIGNAVEENHKEIYDFAGQITLAKLLELGKKVGFDERQVRDIIPALSAKILASETKDLTYKHKNNLFARTGDFSEKLMNAVKSHELRLANCR